MYGKRNLTEMVSRKSGQTRYQHGRVVTVWMNNEQTFPCSRFSTFLNRFDTYKWLDHAILYQDNRKYVKNWICASHSASMKYFFPNFSKWKLFNAWHARYSLSVHLTQFNRFSINCRIDMHPAKITQSVMIMANSQKIIFFFFSRLYRSYAQKKIWFNKWRHFQW